MENGLRRLIEPSLFGSDPVALDMSNWLNSLLQAPSPQPGLSCVELELAIMPTLTLAYPDATRFPLLDFPLHLPVDLLGPSVLIQVLSINMLENKVIYNTARHVQSDAKTLFHEITPAKRYQFTVTTGCGLGTLQALGYVMILLFVHGISVFLD